MIFFFAARRPAREGALAKISTAFAVGRAEVERYIFARRHGPAENPFSTSLHGLLSLTNMGGL